MRRAGPRNSVEFQGALKSGDARLELPLVDLQHTERPVGRLIPLVELDRTPAEVGGAAQTLVEISRAWWLRHRAASA